MGGEKNKVGQEVTRSLLVHGELKCGYDGLVRIRLGGGRGFGGIPRTGGLALLLSHGLLVGLSSPPLGGLGLVAEDEIELIFVARALSPRFGALVAGRFRLIALWGVSRCIRGASRRMARVGSSKHCLLRSGKDQTYLDSTGPAHLAAPRGLAAINHGERW